MAANRASGGGGGSARGGGVVVGGGAVEAAVGLVLARARAADPSRPELVELTSPVAAAAAELAPAPPDASDEAVARRLVAAADGLLGGAPPAPSLPDAAASTCRTCGEAAFASFAEQRAHFRSDFHRLNVKRAAAGKRALSRAEADALFASHERALSHAPSSAPAKPAHGAASEEDADADEVGSLSASGTEDASSTDSEEASLPDSGSDASAGEEGGAATATATARTRARGAGPGGGREDRDRARVVANEPLLGFPTVHEGVWASLYEQVARSRGEFDELLHTPPASLCWAVLLFQAGHFAAVVVRGGKVVLHKSVHRYATRRKQGGSQSAHDNKGRRAKSAGATLRRYGEQTLRDSVTELLKAWDFAPCTRIFLAVPERQRSLFVAQTPEPGDGRFLKGDPRVRRVPFMTRRPTTSEAERVYRILAAVRLHAPPPAPAPASSPTAGQEPNGEGAAAAPPAPAPTAEELAAAEAQRNREMGFFEREVHVAARSNEVASLDRLLAKDPSALEARTADGLTPLHEACIAEAVDAVKWLLSKGADPTRDDFRGRVPYLATSSKAVRNVLREFRGENPERWDWTKAKVPEPAKAETEEERQARLERERVKRAQKREKQRQEEAAEAERKALAEAKEKCPECGNKLPARPADRFSQGDVVFCSSACMRTHGRKLAAAAFDKRAGGGGGGAASVTAKR